MKKQPCFEDVSGFNDRWIILFGLPTASLFITFLLFSDSILKNGLGFVTVCMGMSVIHTATFWIGLRWVYIRTKIRYPKFEQIGHRIVWYLLAFFAIYFVVNKLLIVTVMDMMSENPNENDPNPIITFLSAFLMSALLIILYEAISFYIQLQKAVAEKAELERQNVESQLEGLRNQVNPHFLFNSLNTLAYLIPEDADKAGRFLQQLSNVYRYVLESREAKIIPLQKELEFLDAYVYLLKERFGENFKVIVHDSVQNPNFAIVPLTLQMLFENAIKHNVISVEKPLTIELFRENGCLIVRNNLQRKNQVMDSTGVGLENIQNRYRMLTDKEVELIASQQYFTVALPIIHLNH
jgi:two-component system LytT family sensor kinase